MASGPGQTLSCHIVCAEPLPKLEALILLYTMCSLEAGDNKLSNRELAGLGPRQVLTTSNKSVTNIIS